MWCGARDLEPGPGHESNVAVWCGARDLEPGVVPETWSLARAMKVKWRFKGLSTAWREILNHVIIFDDQHLGRLIALHKEYFNEARPHQDIGQRIPGKTAVAIAITKTIVATPVFRGLHRDDQSAA